MCACVLIILPMQYGECARERALINSQHLRRHRHHHRNQRSESPKAPLCVLACVRARVRAFSTHQWSRTSDLSYSKTLGGVTGQSGDQHLAGQGGCHFDYYAVCLVNSFVHVCVTSGNRSDELVIAQSVRHSKTDSMTQRLNTS